MKKRASVLLALIMGLSSFVAPPTQVSAATPRGITVHVPRDYGSIQAAIDDNVAEAQDQTVKIIVDTGIYRENVRSPRAGSTYHIKAKTPGGAIIDGGSAGSTFTVSHGDRFILEGLSIKNWMSPSAYYSAAVFCEFGALDVRSCEVSSRCHGITSNYAVFTRVVGSTITGSGSSSRGVLLYHQNQVANRQGSYIFSNRFENLDIGIDASESYYPALLCPGGKCGDSNFYYGVNTPYLANL